MQRGWWSGGEPARECPTSSPHQGQVPSTHAGSPGMNVQWLRKASRADYISLQSRKPDSGGADGVQ